MAKIKEGLQPALPGFEGITLRPKRKSSQPHEVSGKVIIRRFKLTQPLTLPLRAEFGSWVETLTKGGGFSLSDILDETHRQIVELYLKPQEKGRWLRQDEVMAKVVGDPEADLKERLIGSIARVIRRGFNGQDAIEGLKPNHFLYQGMLRARLTTVEQVVNLSADDLARVCGTRKGYEELVMAMKKQRPNWQPLKVTFESEKTPDEAAWLPKKRK